MDDGSRMLSTTVENQLNVCDVPSPAPSYTVPGVLCYLESRFHQMESERVEWNLQRVEYEAQIGILTAELTNQRSLNAALVRRIRMLEHALRLERKDATNDDLNMLIKDECEVKLLCPISKSSFSSSIDDVVESGRNLVRRYLNELNVYDRFIDLRYDRNKTAVELADPAEVVCEHFNFLSEDEETNDELTNTAKNYLPSLEPVPSQTEARLIEGGFARGHLAAVRTIIFHPILPILFTGSDDCSIRAFTIKQKETRKRPDDKSINSKTKLAIELAKSLRKHRYAITSLCVSGPSNEYLYSGDVSGVICRWKVPSIDAHFSDSLGDQIFDECFVHNVHHVDSVNCLISVKNGLAIVSVSTDSHVCLWPLSLDTLEWSFSCEGKAVDACDTCSNALIVAVNGSKNQLLLFINVDNGLLLRKIRIDGGDISCISLAYERLLAIALTDCSLQLIDYSLADQLSSKVVKVVDAAHSEYVTGLVSRGTKQHLISVSHEGNLRVWNGPPDELSCCQQLNLHRLKSGEGVLCVALHPLLPLAATGGSDDTVRILKIVSAKRFQMDQERKKESNGNAAVRIGPAVAAKLKWNNVAMTSSAT